MDTGSRSNLAPPPGQTVEPAVERPRQPPGADPGAHPSRTEPYAPTSPGTARSRRRAWPWVLLALVVIGALIWVFLVPHGGAGQGAAGGPHGRGAGGANAPTTVSVAQAQRGDMPIYMNELGAVTPLATVTVQSQIAGYLQQIGFTEGQMVAKGQFLAQIDPRPYQAQLLQAQGALARDQAALAEAQLDLKRYQLLLSQDSIARQQVDVQAATVQQDEGTVKTDEASIVTAKLNIAYCHIVSPVPGRVGLRQVDVGNYVTSGLTNGIVVVTELTPIDVEFTLPEDALPQVAARIHAGAVLPVTAYDRTGTIELASGKLLTLDNVVDPTTGTIKAKARFDNGAGTLFPQQFVNVRILVDMLSNTIVVPTAAVLRGPQGLFVYAVQGSTNNHTVTVRPIKIGPAAGQNTAVTSGLQPGDMIVTDGTDRLREGARVILPGDCIPSGGPGGAGGHGGRRHAAGAADAGPGVGAGRGGCAPGQQPARAPAPGQGATSAGLSASGGPGSSGGAQAGAGAASDQSTGQAGPGQGGRLQAMLSQLDLDPQQQLKAQAIFQAARGQAATAMATAGDDPDARRGIMRQVYGQAFARLEPILRPDQKAKLTQLRAQMAAHGQGQGAQSAQPANPGAGGQ